jgi:tetratricopeptide (TPR) repeat protein
MDAESVRRGVPELARRSLLHSGVHDTFWTPPIVRSGAGAPRDAQLRRALADVADDLDAGLRTSSQLSVLRRFDALAPDIETALGEAHDDGDHELAWRIFGSLGHYWWLKQSRAHSIQWRNRVIDLARLGDVKPGIAARALFVAGASGFAFMKFADNREYLERAAEVADLAAPADSALIHAGLTLAHAFAGFGNIEAVEAGRRAVATAESSRDPFAISFANMALALATGGTFDFTAAIRLANRAVGAADESGAASLQALTRTMLGHLHQYLNDFDSALGAYTGSFWNELADDYAWLTVGARYGAAEAAQMLGDTDEALDGYQTCLQAMRSAGDARGAILASARIGVILAERDQQTAAARNIGFATAHLRFHDEEALRASVLLARAYQEALAANLDAARSDLAQADIHIAGAGSPLGPIDTGLYSKVEAAVTSAAG